MREPNISKDAHKFLKKLPAKHARQIALRITELLTNPEPVGACIVQPGGCWRISSGEYRIIYDYDDTTVNILLIGRRNDAQVYRQYMRKA